MNEVLMELSLVDGNVLEGAQLFPLGEWSHPSGRIRITADRAKQFVRQFKRKAAGQDLPILYIHSDKSNVGNPRYGQAAGWIKDMRADPDRGVVVDIEFTESGAEAVRKREYRYLSAEYFDKVQLPHHGGPEEDVIVGAALVNRPHLKGMDPILNEETGHLFLFSGESKPDESGGGGPVDPILRALAEGAGLELSEDVTELSEEDRQAISKHLQDQSQQVKDQAAKVTLLEEKLRESEASKDPEKARAKSLAEAGFEEEARLLAEFRGDKMVTALTDATEEGFALTPAVKAAVKSYGIEGDVKHLNEALELLASGKGRVELQERGSQHRDDPEPKPSGNAAGAELLKLAEAIAKEEEILLHEAIDRVAAEKPKLWNEYQNAMGGGRGAHLEVV